MQDARYVVQFFALCPPGACGKRGRRNANSKERTATLRATGGAHQRLTKDHKKEGVGRQERKKEQANEDGVEGTTTNE